MDEKPKRKPKPMMDRESWMAQLDMAARFNPCGVCGGERFVWGSASTEVAFRPDVYHPYFRSERIRIRICHQCGNVLFFLKADGALEESN
jgi:hypothetical protein